MTTFPGSPRLVKGAIVATDLITRETSTIVFQYNPKTMRRQLQVTTPQGAGARAEVQRLAGAPAETIDLSVEIDATDQLEVGDPLAAAEGIAPQLAALEVLLYPRSEQVVVNTALLNAGTIEILPPAAPFTIFTWGHNRSLPVRLDGFTVDEQEFDPRLNPIRAQLSLSLRVLSYNDFSFTHPGHALFLAHQVAKEALARRARPF